MHNLFLVFLSSLFLFKEGVVYTEQLSWSLDFTTLEIAVEFANSKQLNLNDKIISSPYPDLKNLPSTASNDKIIQIAKRYLGIPYVWIEQH